MKIISLKAEGICGLADGPYSFAPDEGGPADVVLITGSSTCGKTSLLEAVALAREGVAPYGQPPAPGKALRRGAAAGQLEARWLLSDAEQGALGEIRAGGVDEHGVPLEQDGDEADAVEPVLQTTAAFELPRADQPVIPRRPGGDPAVRMLLSRFSRSPAVGKADYFPAFRQMLPQLWRPMPPKMRDPYEASLRLTKEPTKYGFVPKLLRSLLMDEGLRLQQELAAKGMLMAGDSRDVFAPYREAVAALTDNLRLTSVEPVNDDDVEVLFTRSDGTVVELASLAASEQQAVLFATTFVRYGLSNSIVLIDTPELHQHPSQHLRFFQGLLGLGDNNQVIAATSSPAILEGMTGAHIIDLSKA